MSAALAGVVGALIAGVVGIGGALLAARNDHQKWLRENRLEAYARFLAEVFEASGSRMIGHWRDVEEIRERVTKHWVEGQPLPPGVGEKLYELVNEVIDHERTKPDDLDQAAAAVLVLGPPSVEDSKTTESGHGPPSRYEPPASN